MHHTHKRWHVSGGVFYPWLLSLTIRPSPASHAPSIGHLYVQLAVHARPQHVKLHALVLTVVYESTIRSPVWERGTDIALAMFTAALRIEYSSTSVNTTYACLPSLNEVMNNDTVI